MGTVELFEALAKSGLSDQDYAGAVELIRSLSARSDAGLNLAEVVLANECYQPSTVLAAVGRFYTCDRVTAQAA